MKVAIDDVASECVALVIEVENEETPARTKASYDSTGKKITLFVDEQVKTELVDAFFSTAEQMATADERFVREVRPV